MPAAPKTRKPKAIAPAPAAPQPAPAKPGLSDHELGGLFAEASRAYEFAEEGVRIDSLNRHWTFRPGIQGTLSTLYIQIKRLDDVREDHISTAILASDMGVPMIEDVVRKLDGALA